jgi:glyoxylase-like metal-dependent hydrolase (beta-lactamase superfamily II)
MRWTAVTCFAALCLAAPAGGAPPTEAGAPGRAISDGRLMAPERVTDHVWVMRQPDRLWASVIGNVTIIEQSDGVVLVDSGGSHADGRDVVAAVRQLTPKPIKAVAITHWHNDHPLGVAAILAAFPEARIISTPATREFIQSETHAGIGSPNADEDAARRKRFEGYIAELHAEAAKPGTADVMRAQYELEADWVSQRLERQMGSYAVLPTEMVADKLLLDDAVAPVQLQFLGTGNTHGDLIAWLPRQKTVATGDIVVLPTPYGFTVSTTPWLATLARLEALPFTTLIPGHGKVQRDRDYVRTLEWSMKDIAARARAAAAAGLTKEKAFAAFDQAEQQARFGARDDWTRLWLKDYWLQGMFETAFDEAKGIAAPGK